MQTSLVKNKFPVDNRFSRFVTYSREINYEKKNIAPFVSHNWKLWFIDTVICKSHLSDDIVSDDNGSSVNENDNYYARATNGNHPAAYLQINSLRPLCLDLNIRASRPFLRSSSHSLFSSLSAAFASPSFLLPKTSLFCAYKTRLFNYRNDAS